MFYQRKRLQALRCGPSGSRAVVFIQQLHECSTELLGSPALRLTLECMPLVVANAQLLMQLSSQLLTAGGPPLGAPFAGWTLHWTNALAWRHPDAMQQRPRSPYQPIRWLHQLANLLAQVSRAERLSTQDDSLQARRLRQRMAAAQRLLDPLPAPLRAQQPQERWLWQFLRWGGVGACAALLLRP